VEGKHPFNLKHPLSPRPEGKKGTRLRWAQKKGGDKWILLKKQVKKKKDAGGGEKKNTIIFGRVLAEIGLKRGMRERGESRQLEDENTNCGISRAKVSEETTKTGGGGKKGREIQGKEESKDGGGQQGQSSNTKAHRSTYLGKKTGRTMIVGGCDLPQHREEREHGEPEILCGKKKRYKHLCRGNG